MKVILEAQHAVGHEQLRGVGYYSVQLMQKLLKRKKFEYELTFFDFKKEMGNFARAERYFGKYNVPIHECNELDYRIASRDEKVFLKRSYNSYTNTNGDVYHFMCPVSVPTNITGNMIVSVHDVIWEAYPEMVPPHTAELHKIATKRLNRLKPNIVTISEASRNDILNYMDVPVEKVSVTYMSYDEANMYPDKADISDIVEGDYFLFVGALERRKNIVSIVRAFNHLAEKYKDIKLVIAGKEVWDNYCKELYQSVEESQYKERIALIGYIDTEVKRKLYSNAVGFVFPSYYEGFGIPVLEAMACGCPVITADNSSLPEVGGEAAKYVKADNIEQLAHEMEQIMTKRSLRNMMIEKGFIQKDKFSWEKTAKKIEEFYKKVCEKK